MAVLINLTKVSTMTLEEAEEKLSNMHFDDIVKSYCNKVNYIEYLKEKLINLL